MSEELKQAIQLIKSGEKEAGKNLLIRLVKNDPKNENAWLWLSSVTNGEQRIYCLKKVLEINPQNEKTQAYLKQLTSQEIPIKQSTAVQSGIPEQKQSGNSPRDILKNNEKLSFGPSIQKVILINVLPIVVFFLLIALYFIVKQGWMSIEEVGLLFSFMFFIIVMQLISVFSKNNIEVTRTMLKGPLFFLYSGLHHEIKIADIDLKSTGTTFGFLGYYVIRTFEGSSVYLIGFDEKTMLQIASIIKRFQSE